MYHERDTDFVGRLPHSENSASGEHPKNFRAYTMPLIGRLMVNYAAPLSLPGRPESLASREARSTPRVRRR